MTKYFSLLFIILISIKSNAQYTKLLDFSGEFTGSTPIGNLVQQGEYMYGLTPEGGDNNYGVIFRIKRDGTGFSKIYNFQNYPDGQNPNGSLISDGNYFYGMTFYGGIYGYGTIFKINSDGTNYNVIFNFNSADGIWPYGSLLLDNGQLYGTAQLGGISNKGVIFKIGIDGSNYTKLMEFNGAVSGSNPISALIKDSLYLYGTTVFGGINNFGTLFRIKNDGTDYLKLLDFTGSINGSQPWDGLLLHDNFLYGTTYLGGSNDLGVVFKINTDGSSFEKILEFTGTATGSKPQGALITDGSHLYGLTTSGGTTGNGIIYKVSTDGSDFVRLFNFNGSTTGGAPTGGLISDGSYLYGYTRNGGISNLGTVFKYANCFPKLITNNISICDNQTITVGSHTYSTAGVYKDTLIATDNCDSIIITNLFVNNSSTSIIDINTCDNYTAPDGLVYTSSGVRTAVIPNAAGCDSTITINLTINNASNSSINVTACNTYTAPDGAVYTTSGIKTAVISNAAGCDSTIAINLTINSSADLDLTITQIGNTIEVAENGAIYQWFVCNDTNLPLGGNQNYLPTTDGSYYVIVTKNTCTDSSACFNFGSIGLKEIDMQNIRIYPNPASDKITIKSKDKLIQVAIIDLSGRIVKNISSLNSNNYTFELVNISSGIYYLKIETIEGTSMSKLFVK